MTTTITDREIVIPFYPMRPAGSVNETGLITDRDVHKLVIPSLEYFREIGRKLFGRLFDFQLSNSAESGLVTLMFQNTAWADVGNSGGLQPSTVAGSIYASLHTATLTATSTQSTSEAAYTGYARQGVARSSAGWTVTGSSPTIAENAGTVTYPACTGGSETETNFATGYESSGAGQIFWYGALTASLAVSSGITPSYAIGALQNSLL